MVKIVRTAQWIALAWALVGCELFLAKEDPGIDDAGDDAAASVADASGAMDPPARTDATSPPDAAPDGAAPADAAVHADAPAPAPDAAAHDSFAPDASAPDASPPPPDASPPPPDATGDACCCRHGEDCHHCHGC